MFPGILVAPFIFAVLMLAVGAGTLWVRALRKQKNTMGLRALQRHWHGPAGLDALTDPLDALADPLDALGDALDDQVQDDALEPEHHHEHHHAAPHHAGAHHAPNATRPVCWGIAAPGRIAHDFAAALVGMGACVGAVAAGSLPDSLGRAERFALEYGIPRAYGTYQELAEDANITVVYVASTLQLHYALAKLYLESGKGVLVEKPATVGVAEFEALVSLAREKGVLLATNYWTRFFPTYKWARETIDSGVLGNVVHVSGDFGFQAAPGTPESARLFQPGLGGGSVLDMGSLAFIKRYLVMFATAFLGGPFNETGEVNATVIGNETGLDAWDVTATGTVMKGVDVEAAFILDKGGRLGTFGTSLRRASDFSIQVDCERGILHIEAPANAPVAARSISFQDARSAEAAILPCCQQPEVAHDSFFEPLPPPKPQGEAATEFFMQRTEMYPHSMGFMYVAAAVEQCASTPGCVELEELPLDEQLLIVQLTRQVLDDLGIYKDYKGM